MPGTVLVVAGGARPDPLVVASLPAVDFCVAADGGGDFANALGIEVGALVGDMDSISDQGLAAIRSVGADIEEHPTVKDKTDLELAMLRAMELTPEQVVVIGIAGGRLDHELANFAVLAGEDFSAAPVDALVGSSRLSVVRGERVLTGVLGETVSLLAVNGRAVGVTTEGLQFPLSDETLEAGSARGVSNRFVATRAVVTVRQGVLLSIQPFALKERSTG